MEDRNKQPSPCNEAVSLIAAIRALNVCAHAK